MRVVLAHSCFGVPSILCGQVPKFCFPVTSFGCVCVEFTKLNGAQTQGCHFLGPCCIQFHVFAPFSIQSLDAMFCYGQVAIATARFCIVNGIWAKGDSIIESWLGEALFALSVQSNAIHMVFQNRLLAAAIHHTFCCVHVTQESDHIKIARGDRFRISLCRCTVILELALFNAIAVIV